MQGNERISQLVDKQFNCLSTIFLRTGVFYVFGLEYLKYTQQGLSFRFASAISQVLKSLIYRNRFRLYHWLEGTFRRVILRDFPSIQLQRPERHA